MSIEVSDTPTITSGSYTPEDCEIDRTMLLAYGAPVVEILRSRSLLPEEGIVQIENFCNNCDRNNQYFHKAAYLVIFDLLNVLDKEDDLYKLTLELCICILNIANGSDHRLADMMKALLQENYSLVQQRFLVSLCAEAVIISDEKSQVNTFMVMAIDIINLVNGRCSIDEESTVFISLEFVRIIINSMSVIPIPLKFAMAYYLTYLLSHGFPNGVFQKRSTNRTRVLMTFNLLNLPFFSILNSEYSLENVADDLHEKNQITTIRYSFSYLGAAMLAYIVYVQQFPYFNNPKVYSPSYIFMNTCDSVLFLMLSENPATKQAALSLSSLLLTSIPPHSFHLAICKYSYVLISRFGYLTTYAVLTLLHYYSSVLIKRLQECDASMTEAVNISLYKHIESMVQVLDDESLFPFFIALLNLYLNPGNETLTNNMKAFFPSIPTEKEIMQQYEGEDLVLRRGGYLESDATSPAVGSIAKINYDPEIMKELNNCAVMEGFRVIAFEMSRFTTFLSFLTYHVLRSVSSKTAFSEEDKRHLKIIGWMYAKVMFSFPVEISFIQLETLVYMLQFYTKVYEMGLVEVTEYFNKHLAYILGALQQVNTNLRIHNKKLVYYYHEGLATECTEDQQKQVGLISLFYQYLSLMSYAYGFHVEI